MVGSRVVEMIQDRYENVEDVGTLEYVVQEFFVVIAHFPEKNEKLLMEMDFFRGIRQVSLHHWIVQQSCDSFQHELEV